MISQIVLAAGLSSRMGRLKPLLDFDGVPLLAHLLSECRRSMVDETLVVLGHARDQILQTIDFSDVRVVENPDYRRGQTGSLQAALRQLDPETVAFLNLPVDHPFVTKDEIDALIIAYRDRARKERIFVPDFQGHPGKPVLFDISLQDEILALEIEHPVQGIIARFADAVRKVPVQNPYTMKDMDTPEDYQECLRLFRERRTG